MDSIYKEELLETYKNPKHKGTIKNPTVIQQGENPFCGDEVTLQLKVEKGIIKEAKFKGVACAVSVISSEKLLEFIEGRTVEDALNLKQENLLELLGITVSMTRLRCATLVLTALKKALEKI
ncbi:Fe-S cluster protein [candidate division WWE3 bacterium]|nr:Fe-S cluster protein [candidate division WWE3 bacterium]